MDPTDHALMALDAAMKAKEESVSRGGIGTDLGPILWLAKGSRPLGYCAFDADGPAAIEAMFMHVRLMIALSDAEFAVALIESFAYIGSMEDAPEMPGRGAYAARFASGDERVREALIALCSNGSEDVLFAIAYKYAGRTVLWDGLAPRKCEFGLTDDDWSEALHEGFRLRASRPCRALSLPEIAAALDTNPIVFNPN